MSGTAQTGREEGVDEWSLRYDRYDPSSEGQRETLCTLGNGYFATRGAAPESTAGDIHYPGTYVAGVFNRRPTAIVGTDRGEREHRQPPQLAPTHLPYRRRGLVRSRPGRGARVRAAARSSSGHPHPDGADSRRCRSDDPGAPTPVREPLRSPRGRRPDGGYRRGLGRAPDRPFRPRRGGDQRRRGPLPGARRRASDHGRRGTVRSRDGGPACTHQPVGDPRGHRGQNPRGRGRTGRVARLPGGAWGAVHRPRVHRCRRAGRVGRRGEGGHPLHLPGPRHQRAPARGGHLARPAPRVRGAGRPPRPGVGHRVGRGIPGARGRHPPDRAGHSPPSLPRSPGRLRQHPRPRRRPAGPGPARRGLPGPRLLGRAVRLPLPQPAPAATDTLAPPVPVAPPARGPTGGRRRRSPRRHVPVAERQQRARGDPGRPPQPPLGTLARRRLPPPAAREPGHRLQLLEVLPGHRRPRVHG